MKHKLLLLIIAMLIFCGLSVHAESDGYIVKFKTTPPELDTTIFEEIHAATGVYAVADKTHLIGLSEYIEYVEENEVVEIAEPLEPISLMSLPDDELYSSQWAVQMTNADYAWQHETYGNEIRVAVIDSGCYAHTDLADNLLTGWNYLDNNTNTTDNKGHGTHVSGIIAASMNSSGIVGVAPKAKIVPLKCFDSTKNPTYRNLQDAIYDAVDDYGCKIINMSWGMIKNTTAFQAALDYATRKGVIIVAAVGNDNNATLYYPAASDNVIGVGGVDMYKKKYSKSQVNSSVFIAAPGNNVYSTYIDNSYVYLSGTSMAAPHISGIAALALSVDDSITPAEFAQLLTETAEDLGTEGYDTSFGYGLANVKALVDKLLEDIPYYVSPINTEADESYVLIKNNTKDILSAKSFFAGFSDGRFNAFAENSITVLPDKSIITKTDITNNPSHFLWTSLKSLTPLANKR